MENLTIAFVDAYHLGEATVLESQCFDSPISTQEFMTMYKSPKNMLLGAFIDKKLVAYLLYSREVDHAPTAEILRIAVKHDLRRKGIGTALCKELASYGPADERNVVVRVHELDLDAQLFFRSLSYKVKKIERNFYKTTQNDAYLMEHLCERRECESAG